MYKHIKIIVPLVNFTNVFKTNIIQKYIIKPFFYANRVTHEIAF